MIKRPLNARFSDKVKAEIKITTIRANPWPTDVPIMLYNWSGAAYRSKQIDVAAVVVWLATPIKIKHLSGGEVRYYYDFPDPRGFRLWETEGFESREEMDEWFRKVVKPGQTKEQTLMRFKLHTP